MIDTTVTTDTPLAAAGDRARLSALEMASAHRVLVDAGMQVRADARATGGVTPTIVGVARTIVRAARARQHATRACIDPGVAKFMHVERTVHGVAIVRRRVKIEPVARVMSPWRQGASARERSSTLEAQREAPTHFGAAAAIVDKPNRFAENHGGDAAGADRFMLTRRYLDNGDLICDDECFGQAHPSRDVIADAFFNGARHTGSGAVLCRLHTTTTAQPQKLAASVMSIWSVGLS